MSFIFLSKHKKKYAVPFSALSSFLAIKEHQERFSLAASYFRSFFFSLLIYHLCSCVYHVLLCTSLLILIKTEKENLNTEI